MLFLRQLAQAERGRNMGSNIGFYPSAAVTIPATTVNSEATHIDTHAVDKAPSAHKVVEPDTQSQSMTFHHENIQATYDYDKDLNQIIIKLRSEDTGEVIQQIPPEKIINLIASFMNSVGKSIDKEA
jgi:flagellar protein FlaG